MCLFSRAGPDMIRIGKLLPKADDAMAYQKKALTRIVSNPDIMLGKPVISGTRITVEHVLRELLAGSTPDDLISDHPGLTREHIQAAIDFGLSASARAIENSAGRESA